MIIFSEIVKVLDVSPFHLGDGDEFRFRLEISCELNTTFYFGKVYRLETYRLQPTFPQIDGELPSLKNDALIYVVDEIFDANLLRATSVEAVLANFEKVFNSIFKNE